MSPSFLETARQAFGIGALRVLWRNVTVWLKYAKSSAIGNFGDPIIQLLVVGYGFGRLVPVVDGVPYMQFLGTGMVVATAMYTATFECTFGSFTRLESQRTYDAIAATPISFPEIAFGDILWGATKATIGSVAVLLVALAFRLIASPLAILVLPLALIAGVLFSAMALMVTTLAGSYEYFNYYFTLVVTPMFLFSGIFFPIHDFVGPLRVLSWCLPLTHVVDLSRALMLGRLVMPLWQDLAWILVFTAIVVPLAIGFVVRRMVK